MKKIIITTIFILSVLMFLPIQTMYAAEPVWKPTTPEGYKPISWAKAYGVNTFIKTPTGNGTIDFLTSIYLPYNEVKLVATSTPRVDWGAGAPPFATDTIHNWAVARIVAEDTKTRNPDASFFWNAPFFNITASVTDLSMALKSTDEAGDYITSGSRPENDMLQSRRMLIINNKLGKAKIVDFDVSTFTNSEEGDQAVEGFAPTVFKTDGPSGATARLFLGIKSDGKELIVYCSNVATIQNASDALAAAGVPVENQMQVDGGGSATCGYNLPGQYFVEPIRTLPYLMGTFPIVLRGTVTIDKLNVRSGPGTNFKAVDRLAKGTKITAVEEKSGWYRLAKTNNWVSKQYIKNQ